MTNTCLGLDTVDEHDVTGAVQVSNVQRRYAVDRMLVRHRLPS